MGQQSVTEILDKCQLTYIELFSRRFDVAKKRIAFYRAMAENGYSNKEIARVSMKNLSTIYKAIQS